MEEVRRLFKPEFLNRIDEIMVFHTLNKQHLRKIVSLLLKNLESRCQEQMDIRLKITDSVKDYLSEAGFDINMAPDLYGGLFRRSWRILWPMKSWKEK